MIFRIPDEIKDQVSSVEYIKSDKAIAITFTNKHENKEVKFSPFNLKNIPTSLSNLETKVKDIMPNIPFRLYNQIEDLISFGIKDLVKEEAREFENVSVKEISDNCIFESDKKIRKKKVIVVNKYSQNRRGDLYESILIQKNPVFVSIGNSPSLNDEIKDFNREILNYEYKNISINSIEYIEENTRVLIPPSLEEYLHNPYEFQSIDDLNQIIENMCKKETLFSLYAKTKSIVSKYVDQEEYIINLIAVDVVFSYFSDRFSTVHYTGIFGANGSGKSSIGDIVEALAYRAVNTTDPSAANIFRSLGSVEPAQITLVMDEFDKIDQSPQIMAILKTGYDFKKIVSKVNQYTGIPEKFYTYCPKYIIGEKPPSMGVAYGVMDRTFANIVYYGKPKYDIKEILNPTDTGGSDYRQLYNEIEELRKSLFVYRILHFKDKIKNIHVGIEGRNKELVKPYLQLFSDIKTVEDQKVYDELQRTFQILLKVKNEKKEFTIEATLLPLILQLMEEESKIGTITFSYFWDTLQYHIRGKLDERKPNEYHSEEFGTIYRNSISNILQKLGVTSKHCRNNTQLIFDKKKIMKNAIQYNIYIQTKLDTLSNDPEICNSGESKIDSNIRNGEHCEHCEHPLDKEIIKNQKIDKNNGKVNPESTNNKVNDDEFSNVVNQKPNTEPKGLEKEMSRTFEESSQRSPTHTDNILSNNEINIIENKTIFRIGHTDTWRCKHCNDIGDKWYMLKHPCHETLSRDSKSVSP
ncbi:MAG: hypothetical protein AB7V56_10205 [Candidatus Nitrosocosmicus sp.]